MSIAPIAGIVAYPITPFRPGDGAVDLPRLKSHIDQIVSSGVQAIAPLGSTGECAYLDDAEWEAVAHTSTAQVGGRIPVIMGVSTLTTASACRRATFAERAGADAVMVLPQAYWKLGEDEIYHHFAQVAGSISIPVMVYNNPATSGIDMSPELMVRMVREIHNITMIKESSGDIRRMHRIVQLTEGQVPFFNGSNPLALDAFAAGATGWCSAAACLIPEWTLQLYQTARAGQLEQARAAFYRQLPLLQFILAGGLPKTIKAGLKLRGFDVGVPREPVRPLDEAGTQTLAGILDLLVSP